MELKKSVSKHWVVTSTTGKHKEWYRIVVDGVKTNFEINRSGIVRDRDTKVIKKEIKFGGNAENHYMGHNFNINGEIVSIGTHRLLACVFIPIPRELRELGYDQVSLIPNHLDGNKSNNDLSNLEWTTVSGNMQHALENGLCDTYIGEKSHLAKIDEAMAHKICKLLQDGIPTREVAEQLGVSVRTVRHIYSGECWKQVSKDYHFNKRDVRAPGCVGEDSIRKACDMMKHDAELLGQVYGLDYISNKCGMASSYLIQIKNGKGYNHITKDYDFSALRRENRKY